MVVTSRLAFGVVGRRWRCEMLRYLNRVLRNVGRRAIEFLVGCWRRRRWYVCGVVEGVLRT